MYAEEMLSLMNVVYVEDHDLLVNVVAMISLKVTVIVKAMYWMIVICVVVIVILMKKQAYFQMEIVVVMEK